MRRWTITLGLTLLTLSLVLLFIVKGTPYSFASLLEVSIKFLAFGTALAILDLCLRAVRMSLVATKSGHPLSILRSVRIVMAVDFFAAITPARVGGQTARIVGFMQAGLKPSAALAVTGSELLMDFGYIFLAVPACFLLMRESFLKSMNLDSPFVLFLPFTLIAAIIIIFSNEKLTLAVLNYLHARLRFLRRLVPEKIRVHIKPGLVNFRQEFFKLFKQAWWVLPVGVVLTSSWWIVRFSSLIWIAAALGYSIGLQEVYVPQFLLANTLIYTPVPLSGGLFEASFMFIYKQWIPAAHLASTLILWRFFTYFIFLVLGGFFTTRTMWTKLLQRMEPEKTEQNPAFDGPAS